MANLKTKVLMIFMSLVLGCLSLSLIAFRFKPAAVSAMAANAPTSSIIEAPVLKAAASDGGDVYDANEKPLMYNPQDGQVYTEDGIVFDKVGLPLTYNPQTEKFKNSKNQELELLERAVGGLQNYYLVFGGYKVNSIILSNKLYLFEVKANTTYNFGAEYDLLVTVSYIKAKWYEKLTGVDYHIEYYDLNGHRVDYSYLKDAPKSLNGSIWVGSVAVLSTYKRHLDTKYWGTIGGLLERIQILVEQDTTKEGFALNPTNGDFLRDDLGNKIRIGEKGQLLDVVFWPIIGADAWPVWWDSAHSAYINYSGSVLTISTDNRLVDGDKIVHSIIEEVVAGASVYILYLSDGVTRIPVTLKTLSTKPFTYEFYDLNGKVVSADKIAVPEVFDPYQEGQSFGDWFRGLFSGGDCGLSDIKNILILIGAFLLVVFVIWFISKIIGWFK